jgi:protein-tyrosine-phosphatase
LIVPETNAAPEAKADLPNSVLFACNHNVIRSPIAEAILKHWHGRSIFVDSVGVHAGEPDPFVVAVMEEIGIDMSRHRPKSFAELEDPSAFDLVISLTPEAQHAAVELTRHHAVDLAYWPSYDPTAVHGSREQRLEAYRTLRNDLMARIRDYFGPPHGAVL